MVSQHLDRLSPLRLPSCWSCCSREEWHPHWLMSVLHPLTSTIHRPTARVVCRCLGVSLCAAQNHTPDSHQRQLVAGVIYIILGVIYRILRWQELGNDSWQPFAAAGLTQAAAVWGPDWHEPIPSCIAPDIPSISLSATAHTLRALLAIATSPALQQRPQNTGVVWHVSYLRPSMLSLDAFRHLLDSQCL
jgi:hypothetical protein